MPASVEERSVRLVEERLFVGDEGLLHDSEPEPASGLVLPLRSIESITRPGTSDSPDRVLGVRLCPDESAGVRVTLSPRSALTPRVGVVPRVPRRRITSVPELLVTPPSGDRLTASPDPPGLAPRVTLSAPSEPPVRARLKVSLSESERSGSRRKKRVASGNDPDPSMPVPSPPRRTIRSTASEGSLKSFPDRP